MAVFILLGRTARNLLEYPSEIRQAVKPDLARDFRNVFICFNEQFLSLVDTDFVQIFGIEHTRCLLKNTTEIARAKMKPFRDEMQIQILAIMARDIRNRVQNRLMLGVIFRNGAFV